MDRSFPRRVVVTATAALCYQFANAQSVPPEYELRWAANLNAANSIIDQQAARGWLLKSVSTVTCQLVTDEPKLASRTCFVITFERPRRK